MQNSVEETDDGNFTDEGQLTIRIPNPKVYMARQSLWVGRRGKPRCDHCRLNNLKCDRMLPSCNHCSWASNGRDCKYTPLPTPAHRGIPRCDRCRARNLKCDRNLPTCNHCKSEEGSSTGCTYSPKRRRNLKAENTPFFPTEERLESKRQSAVLAAELPGQRYQHLVNGGHTFYGQNIATSSSLDHERSPPSSDTDYVSISNPASPCYAQGNLAKGDYFNLSSSSQSPLPPSTAKPSSLSESQLSYVTAHLSPDDDALISCPHVEPWFHPSFAPLPEHIILRLALINSVEIPDRKAFDQSLQIFLDSLMDELQETACLAPDTYAKVALCLSRGEKLKLSHRMRAWISCHKLCAGSQRHHLIVMQKEAMFRMEDGEVETLRQSYCHHIDGKYRKESGDYSKDFERLPVQNQIYDILSYAHRSHANPTQMLQEIRQLSFAFITWPMAEMYIRLCPLCNLRSKQPVSHVTVEKLMTP